jgi:hypothetical protein
MAGKKEVNVDARKEAFKTRFSSVSGNLRIDVATATVIKRRLTMN